MGPTQRAQRSLEDGAWICFAQGGSEDQQDLQPLALLGLVSHPWDFTVSLWELSLHFGPGNFEADVHR